jgi:hypothetical protein
MNQLLKKLWAPTLSGLLVLSPFAFAGAAQSMQQEPNQQEQNSNQVNPQQHNGQKQHQPESNVQQQKPQANTQQQQPQANARQKNIQTITGKVTRGGGFVAQDGAKYRLNGARAAELRDWANKAVTIKGHMTKFEGHNAIDVQSFKAAQSGMAENNTKQPESQSNFRSQHTPQPGNTGYMPKQQNQQQQQNR